ncbi:homeobox protein MSH-D [Sitodiplosis mosellana]|uniref:homeobox protein MSH-D n=1 Tax=Sitodiplosis mosellana TaxID=263140 RepID=UPI00244400B8|nr:homeobox protein MSH-D [Sitodiplosis mosellana]
MDIDNIPSAPGNQKPVIRPQFVNKPSNFSIDHILNSAGSTRDKYMSDCGKQQTANELHNLNNQQSDHFIIESDVHQYPPILNWLQYTRYKPPRLPRPVRNGPIKRTPGRLPRIPFTPFQLNELETAYKRANYLSSEDANKLAIRLDLTCVRVKIWFQNRRARERREKRELNTTPPSISPNHSPLH